MAAGASTKGAKAEDAKTGEEDLSMEEILQSIRRIIAEDDTEGKKAVAEPTKANGTNGKNAKDDVPGSDVLELTEMLKDDGTVVSLKNEPVAAAAPKKADAPADVLNKIDEALTPEKPMDKKPEAAPVKAEEKPAAAPAAPSAQDAIDAMMAAPAAPAAAAAPVAAAPAAAPAAAAPKAPIDSILSAEAAGATADAFQRLRNAEPEPPPLVTTPAPAFRSGGTVEDMVTDMLRPMMKSWLDANLPAIVERIVEREVKKLTK